MQPAANELIPKLKSSIKIGPKRKLERILDPALSSAMVAQTHEITFGSSPRKYLPDFRQELETIKKKNFVSVNMPASRPRLNDDDHKNIKMEENTFEN